MRRAGSRIRSRRRFRARYQSREGVCTPRTSRSVVTASAATSANGAGCGQSRKWFGEPPPSRCPAASASARRTVGGEPAELPEPLQPAVVELLALLEAVVGDGLGPEPAVAEARELYEAAARLVEQDEVLLVLRAWRAPRPAGARTPPTIAARAAAGGRRRRGRPSSPGFQVALSGLWPLRPPVHREASGPQAARKGCGTNELGTKSPAALARGERGLAPDTSLVTSGCCPS